MAPLLLALRALIQQSKEIKQQFSLDGLKTLFLVVSQAHGHKEFKNIYVSGMILMCELENNLDEKNQEGSKVFK